MDTLQRFSAGGICQKCTTSPVAAKYCERDCSQGESSDKDTRSAGGHFTSEIAPLGSSPLAHLHRVCRGCGYEWLEQTADAQPSGDEKACGFCLRTKTACGEMIPSVAFMEGAAGSVCHDCIVHLHASTKQLMKTMGADTGKPSTTAH